MSDDDRETKKKKIIMSVALTDDTLSSTWPKKVVNSFAVEELTHRVEMLRKFKPLSNAVLYDSVVVTPMTVVLRSSETSRGKERFAPLPRQVSEQEAKAIVRQVLLLLYALHQRKCCCGSLRPDNFRWDPTAQQILLVNHVIPPTMFVVGTAPHRDFARLAAPEILSNQLYGSPADVWTVGVVLAHLLTSRSQELETDDLVDTGVLSPIVNRFTPSLVSLLCKCLKTDPNGRPTIVDLVFHPYFADGFDNHGDERTELLRYLTGSERSSASMEEEEEEEASADDETASTSSGSGSGD